MESQPPVLLCFKLPVSVKYDENSRCFSSYCAPLDLHSAGKTERDAHEAIKSAVSMFVRLCFQRNVLDDFLTERGFTITQQAPDVRSTQPIPSEQPQWYIALLEFGGKTDQVEVSFPLSSLRGSGGGGGLFSCQA